MLDIENLLFGLNVQYPSGRMDDSTSDQEVEAAWEQEIQAQTS